MWPNSRPLVYLLSVLVLGGCHVASARGETDVNSKVSSVGSDTLSGIMTRWSELYRDRFPEVIIQIQASGSSTAPPALIEGTASLGPMSRRMNRTEKRRFRASYGYDPTEIVVGFDAIAVFVNHENPIQALTLAQLDALFSGTNRCGGVSSSETWRDLGVTTSLGAQKVSLFGRNSASGTYTFFREKALCGGDFRKRVNEQPGSSSVVQSVGVSPRGIGYSGIGYVNESVKVLALISERGEPVFPTAGSALQGTYPLARPLYIYVNQPSDQALTGRERQFLELALSPAGQQVITDYGFIALPESLRLRVRAQLGIDS